MDSDHQETVCPTHVWVLAPEASGWSGARVTLE